MAGLDDFINNPKPLNTMSLEDFIERPVDPNAPKTLDLAKANRLIALSEKYQRLPTGDVIREIASQLKCALEEISGTSTKVVNAQNDVIRYQRESQVANAEVSTMQGMLVKAREDLHKALEELGAARATIAATPPAPAEKPKAKRGRPAKIVQLNEPQQKAAQ